MRVRVLQSIARAVTSLRALTLICGVTLAVPASALAQTVYVSDELRIALRSGPGEEFRALRILLAGTELSELERREPWVRVEIAGGPEGWVQSRYLTEETPARVQLPRVLEAQERNRAIIERLEAEVAKLDGASQEAARLRETGTQLAAENARLLYSERSRDMISGAGIVLAGILVGALWPRRNGANS